MIPADETFEDTWSYAPRFFEGAGFRMHYVDEGPPDAELYCCMFWRDKEKSQ